MKIEKILGWILLIIGIGIILWTLNVSWEVFRGERQVFQMFKPKEISMTSKTPQNLEEKIQQEISQVLKESLPIEEIYRFFNLISFSIFSGVFIFGGFQVASLGIKLLK